MEKKNKKVAKKVFLPTLADEKLPEKKKEKKRKTRVKENFPNTETVTHRYSTKLQSYCREKLG